MVERLSRVAVVDRAADLADEIGLHEVTITKLGRALAIAPPGVYRHVADIVDLRGAIGEQAARELSAVLSSACAGLSGSDSLTALAHALRVWAKQHPGRYTALQIAPGPEQAAYLASAEELLTAIAAALRAYELSGDDLTDVIRILRSSIHGFVALEVGDGFREPRSVDATYERMICSIDTMLRSWTS